MLHFSHPLNCSVAALLAGDAGRSAMISAHKLKSSVQAGRQTLSGFLPWLRLEVENTQNDLFTRFKDVQHFFTEDRLKMSVFWKF